ncbi:MAG: peptide deformylase [Burkholderiales bacterium]|nr:MAG: peptide deformylase [Betaproteobacteria bacterium TMED22]|tara:strand:- start:391 stop:897 length:507 start_codon:yes stop_codon:yes gene_type:complete
MSILNILQHPDDRLHVTAKRVERVGKATRQLVEDMAETMYSASGIGLAATQVNVPERVIVVDITDTRDDLLVLINPEIESREGTVVFEEGCLSVPGIYDRVERSERIMVRALNVEGEAFNIEAAGILSVCIQHEIDHLDGKVFVEYLSRLKQNRIIKKLLKNQRNPDQ